MQLNLWNRAGLEVGVAGVSKPGSVVAPKTRASKVVRGKNVSAKAGYAYYKVTYGATLKLKQKKTVKLIPSQPPFRIQHGGGGGNKGNNRHTKIIFEDDDEDNNNSNNQYLDFLNKLYDGYIHVLRTLLIVFVQNAGPFVRCVALWSSSVVLADTLAQLLCCFRNKNFDVSRLLNIFQYSCAVRGPALFLMSLLLRPYYSAFGTSLVRRTVCTSGMMHVMRNMVLDLGPQMGVLCGLYSFFFPIIEGKGVAAGQESVRESFVPILGSAYQYWPVIYFTRYTMVQQKYAMMYLYGADFLYALYHSSRSIAEKQVARKNLIKFTPLKNSDSNVFKKQYLQGDEFNFQFAFKKQRTQQFEFM